MSSFAQGMLAAYTLTCIQYLIVGEDNIFDSTYDTHDIKIFKAHFALMATVCAGACLYNLYQTNPEKNDK